MFNREKAIQAEAKIDEPRFLDLFTAPSGAEADLVLAGVPYDVSVIGRKGARLGPEAIREALRFIACHDPDTNQDMSNLNLFDAGDVEGLSENVLASHDLVQAAAKSILGTKPAIILGGDHGLTFPHIAALAQQVEGNIGIVVIDAHYDLRGWSGQPTSGTPFRRILDELGGRVKGENIVEIGIRPWANSKLLADLAAERGVHIVTPEGLRAAGLEATLAQALAQAGRGVDHLWVSVDIDGLDQSIAPGCSAPGAGGLSYAEADAIVRGVASDPRCRGMDILEVAPNLDASGNTARAAAQLCASFTAATLLR